MLLAPWALGLSGGISPLVAVGGRGHFEASAQRALLCVTLMSPAVPIPFGSLTRVSPLAGYPNQCRDL